MKPVPEVNPADQNQTEHQDGAREQNHGIDLTSLLFCLCVPHLCGGGFCRGTGPRLSRLFRSGFSFCQAAHLYPYNAEDHKSATYVGRRRAVWD